MTDTLRDDLQAALGAAYVVERELSGGGMSRVFVAEEVRLRRKVVIKVLPPAQAAVLSAERFEREIQLAARLQHPHIVPVITAGDVSGIPYYTMPFVRGESLRARMSAGALPRAEAIKILSDIASALAYAHSEGIVHRDIKPENVLISSGNAVVTDFGIAKALQVSQVGGGPGAELTLTERGASIGTPAYMAPEQAVGDKAGPAADVYSWGLIAYELLGGEHPFAHERTAQQMVMAQLTKIPEPLAGKVPDVAPSLATLVTRSLEKDPAKRPANGNELCRSLEALSTGENAVHAREMRRSPRLAWIAAGAAALLVIAFFAAQSRVRPASAAVSPGVLVVPFQNFSGDTASEYFSDGMTEELVGILQRSGGLRVASRAATFSYKGKQEDPKAIGAKMHVDAVLSGSVRRAQDRLRIAAELVRTSDGQSLWSESYDRTPNDVFAIQEEISRAIASALKVALVRKPNEVVKSANLEAYDYYLKALQQTRGRRATRQSLERRIALLDQSIQRDSSFASAWAELAQAKLSMSDFVTPMSVLPQAKIAAQRAARLDPTSSDVALALADITFNYDWNWPAAEREYKRALSLDPQSVSAHRRYGGFLIASRRMREAQEEIAKANELSWSQSTDTVGLRAYIEGQTAYAYSLVKDNAAAREHMEKALALAPDSWSSHWGAGLLCLIVLDYPRAVAEFQTAERLAGDKRLPLFTHLALAYAHNGQTDSAKKRLSDLLERSKSEYVPKDQISMLYYALGDRSSALKWFSQAIDEHHYWLPSTNGSVFAERLRTDPDFRRLMKRLNVPDAAL
jgi:serine/threonine-protein kinase